MIKEYECYNAEQINTERNYTNYLVQLIDCKLIKVFNATVHNSLKLEQEFSRQTACNNFNPIIQTTISAAGKTPSRQ